MIHSWSCASDDACFHSNTAWWVITVAYLTFALSLPLFLSHTHTHTHTHIHTHTHTHTHIHRTSTHTCTHIRARTLTEDQLICTDLSMLKSFTVNYEII